MLITETNNRITMIIYYDNFVYLDIAYVSQILSQLHFIFNGFRIF